MDREPYAILDRRVVGFGIYLIALNLVLIYVLIRIWPGDLSSEINGTEITLLPGVGPEFILLPETRYLLIAALAGALGSYIHLATSFADFVGNRRLVWRRLF